MPNLRQYLRSATWPLLLSVLVGCEGIYDDEENCESNYYVRFISDMNLYFVDAFEKEVNSVAIYAFDADSTLALVKEASGDVLHPAEGKYAMDISELPAGHYHIVAWGGLDGSNGFELPEMKVGKSKLSDMKCLMKRTEGADGSITVSTDLDPLFHGSMDIDIDEDAEPGTYYSDIRLTKNTNSMTIVLHQLGSEPLSQDDYSFRIDADNGHIINHDNSLQTDDQLFTYLPWNISEGVVGSSTDSLSTDAYRGPLSPAAYAEAAAGATRVEDGSVAILVANMTVSRLMKQDYVSTTYPRLVITHKDKSEESPVISIPIVDYTLLVKGRYDGIATDQEYLDRQKDYNITFFLNDGKWVSSEIIINSWRIVLNNKDLQ